MQRISGPNENLSRDEAAWRAQTLKVLSYQVELDLGQAQDAAVTGYRSTTTLVLEAHGTGACGDDGRQGVDELDGALGARRLEGDDEGNVNGELKEGLNILHGHVAHKRTGNHLFPILVRRLFP